MGLGTFTFVYAKGTSYLTDDPAACANCHIMRDQYDGWQKSGHHAYATCNDCHVPHAFIPKYMTKGENGFEHSKAFTLQNFHEPIMIRARSARIVQANCVRCHGDLVSEMISRDGAHSDAFSCARCHSQVGHGPTR